MARDKRPPVPRRKKEPDAYHSKIRKTQSEHKQDDALRHAVRTQDVDAFEDWDEPDY